MGKRPAIPSTSLPIHTNPTCSESLSSPGCEFVGGFQAAKMREPKNKRHQATIGHSTSKPERELECKYSRPHGYAAFS